MHGRGLVPSLSVRTWMRPGWDGHASNSDVSVKTIQAILALVITLPRLLIHSYYPCHPSIHPYNQRTVLPRTRRPLRNPRLSSPSFVSPSKTNTTIDPTLRCWRARGSDTHSARYLDPGSARYGRPIAGCQTCSTSRLSHCGEDSKPELIISAGRHTRWTRLNMRAEHRLDTAAEIASTGRAEAGGGS